MCENQLCSSMGLCIQVMKMSLITIKKLLLLTSENSLDDGEPDHSVGLNILEGSGTSNLSDFTLIQTKSEILTEELPDVSKDTSVMHADVEDIDTTGIKVVSSNQTGEDSILVSQCPAEEDSDNQTNTPATDEASVLEEIAQTPDPYLHNADIAESILNLSLAEPVTENVSGQEGHHLITSSEEVDK